MNISSAGHQSQTLKESVLWVTAIKAWEPDVVQIPFSEIPMMWGGAEEECKDGTCHSVWFFESTSVGP